MGALNLSRAELLRRVKARQGTHTSPTLLRAYLKGRSSIAADRLELILEELGLVVTAAATEQEKH